MAGVKRRGARIVGERRARDAASKAGGVVRLARKRRRKKQETLASEVGISQGRLAELEAGRGTGAPPEVWFALGEVLGVYFRFEFGRDPQSELRDAGHLDIQELMLRVATAAGWERAWQAPSRAWGSDRSVDVRLLDRTRRRLVISECWNTFGDLGEAARSGNRKVADALEQAVAIAGDGPPFQVGLVWVVRDTKANRAILARYAQIFAARFPGSSAGWVLALTTNDAPMPTEPALVWCDVRATRLFARRRGKPSR